MTLNNFTIREILPEDNPKIAKAIRVILIEYGVPKIGTAYADKILDTLFEAYDIENDLNTGTAEEGAYDDNIYQDDLSKKSYF